MNFTFAQLSDFVAKVGVPFAVLVIILYSLAPKIDHGIAVADHVDALLTYLAANGCAPTPIPPRP